MKLAEYLNGMHAAQNADELEAAIRADFKHSFRGRTWSQICRAREEAGNRIVASHPLGSYVPQYGPYRRLTVFGETYKVARGGNSTGVRYSWHAAGVWAMAIMCREGLSIRASHRIWDNWSGYPHRALQIVQAALDGAYPDPELNVPIKCKHYGHEEPIRYTVQQNEADKWDRRATMPCPECEGTLFDWGAGYSEGFDYISWYCNGCPARFTEYVTRERMREIRQPRAAA